MLSAGDCVQPSSSNNINDFSKPITIKLKYSGLMPPISDTEFQSIKDSIKANGLLVPVTITRDGVVLDGHNRIRACKELRLPLKYHRIEFITHQDPLEEKRLAIDLNLKRRQLNIFQKIQLGYLLEGIVNEKARQREQSTFPKKGEKGFQHLRIIKESMVSSMEDSTEAILQQAQKQEDKGNSDIGRVSHIIANKIAMSHSTYEKGKAIILKGTEEQKDNLTKGVSSITRVYNEIKQQEKRDQLIKEARDAVANNPKGEDSRVKLIQNDFQSVDAATINDASIDLIFTDP